MGLFPKLPTGFFFLFYILIYLFFNMKPLSEVATGRLVIQIQIQGSVFEVHIPIIPKVYLVSL